MFKTCLFKFGSMFSAFYGVTIAGHLIDSINFTFNPFSLHINLPECFIALIILIFCSVIWEYCGNKSWGNK